jgi:hypothetical protein
MPFFLLFSFFPSSLFLHLCSLFFVLASLLLLAYPLYCSILLFKTVETAVLPETNKSSKSLYQYLMKLKKLSEFNGKPFNQSEVTITKLYHLRLLCITPNLNILMQNQDYVVIN